MGSPVRNIFALYIREKSRLAREKGLSEMNSKEVKPIVMECRRCGTTLFTGVFTKEPQMCECGAIGYDSMEGTKNVRILFKEESDIIYL